MARGGQVHGKLPALLDARHQDIDQPAIPFRHERREVVRAPRRLDDQGKRLPLAFK